MGTRRATIMECDNPSCDEEYEHTTEDPAPGYHLGKGYWVIGGGGPIPKVYAHDKDCIGPAVQHVIEESLRSW